MVPSRDTVTATEGTRVAPPLCRKKATTPITRTVEIARVVSTSLRDERMVIERSITGSRSMSGGMAVRSVGSFAFTASTVWMILAPGARLTTTVIAFWPLTRPVLWMSCGPSTTWATSSRRTARPLR